MCVVPETLEIGRDRSDILIVQLLHDPAHLRFGVVASAAHGIGAGRLSSSFADASTPLRAQTTKLREDDNMKTLALVVAGAISMFGCASLGVAADKIADSDAAQVASCTFLKDINGRSVFARLQAEGLAKAKEDARNQAAKVGATNIVWGEMSQVDVTTIAGKAYRCPK
jgi:hypothetical protein